jgi:PAS domain S-box-containing protein
MSSSAQFHFAAEFVTFLAAAAGLALVLLRSELVSRAGWAKPMMAGGFLAIGTAAFLQGSLIVSSDYDHFALVLRGVGIVAALAGSVSWTASPNARAFLWVGLALLAGALAIEANRASSAADALLTAGAVGIGIAVLTVSRRSIAARVAATAAGALLLLVLVLSLALSSVLSSTVQREAFQRLNGRAAQEASSVTKSTNDVVTLGAVYATLIGRTHTDEVLKLAQDANAVNQPDPACARLVPGLGSAPPTIGQCIQSDTTKLQQKKSIALAYLAGASDTPVAQAGFDGIAPSAAPALLLAVAKSPVVKEVTCPNGYRTSVELVGNRAMSVAAIPVCPDAPGTPVALGKFLVVSPLNDAYLNGRSQDDAALSLALVSRAGVLAHYGDQPATKTLQQLADQVLASGGPRSVTANNRFAWAQPVFRTADDTAPIMTLVASTPTTLFDDTRRQLFRSLFLIALGGTLLALLIASLVGERIGAGLRRLTLAAGSIQAGDFSVRAEVVSDDEVGILGAAFDSMAASIEEKTTALRQAADDETRLRNRLEAVVAGMGEALIAVDAHGRITDFNQAAEELVGVAAGDAFERPADQVLRLISEDGDDLSGRLRKPLPRRWSATATLAPRDDAGVPVAVSAGVLRGAGGELAGGVFVLRDLRREREIERMKTEFLSHVGHELRTPLAGVLGHAEILTRRQLPAAQTRVSHEEILKSGKRLERIVEMLEFFASSGAGRVPLRPEHLHVRSLVDDAVTRWQSKFEKPPAITRRVARTIPDVTADRRWLTASIDELIDNALKFSPNGARITVTAAEIDPQAAHNGNGAGPARNGRARGARVRARRGAVEISVIDRGKGMSPDEQELAFSDFAQGDGSDTRRYGGLGLGLALVKRVAEAHGGSVHCESTPGKGSKFSIVLPAVPKNRRR